MLAERLALRAEAPEVEPDRAVRRDRQGEAGRPASVDLPPARALAPDDPHRHGLIAGRDAGDADVAAVVWIVHLGGLGRLLLLVVEGSDCRSAILEQGGLLRCGQKAGCRFVAALLPCRDHLPRAWPE